MSNKLNRAARRSKTVQERVFHGSKDNLYKHLEKAEKEMKDAMEHQYTGIWFSCAAVAMARARLSQRTIQKVLSLADDLYGKMQDETYSVDDLIRMAEDEAGIRVEFNVDRDYMTIVPFETGRAGYDNLTMIERIKADRYDYRESKQRVAAQH